ncbi:malto-oligosyltrehalose trehalohydrolase [Desulfocurvibacter africanus]|uniref:malto-oligosyltrehalose trehalohydrolase n=1 Tax=Desulfocurvibacter africanus TaxID=873 RepID=UPI0003F913F3|nr:malto-oligosyltrehalose trehalohydrolase [Desulfocurvibacter africanus]
MGKCSSPSIRRRIGAWLLPGCGCRFTVWAPARDAVRLRLVDSGRSVDMLKDEQGYFTAEIADLAPGALYLYDLGQDGLRPDPASRFQPEGVHGPSMVVSSAYDWDCDTWQTPPLSRWIIYELHVGAFTPEGTFDAAIKRLDHIAELGATCVEIMPVAAFSGCRNWGYDGVYPFAVQACYGGPDGLKRLVDACHARGMAAVLDVVYNHLGPEGNYLSLFGPYFTDKYHTPWGLAVNFDGPWSDGVREYFFENARQWFEEFRFDGLRLDACHAIFDQSAVPFLQELAERTANLADELGWPCVLIAESDQNKTRTILPVAEGGLGMQAQWADDFHHALHTLLTGEREGYYEDFGQISQLATAYEQPFVYSRTYSTFRQRTHGSSAAGLPGERFVVCAQNHDQVGNRMLGERLSTLISFEACKLAAAALLLSPFVPLLFMGEEFLETNPFLYFVNHEDQALNTAVREGRRKEFESFRWQGEPPDPVAAATFERSRLDWAKIEGDYNRHTAMLAFYRRLTALRASESPLMRLAPWAVRTLWSEKGRWLYLLRSAGEKEALICLNFATEERQVRPELTDGCWDLVLDSSDPTFAGPGSSLTACLTPGETLRLPPESACLFIKKRE